MGREPPGAACIGLGAQPLALELSDFKAQVCKQLLVCPSRSPSWAVCFACGPRVWSRQGKALRISLPSSAPPPMVSATSQAVSFPGGGGGGIEESRVT